MNIIQICAMSIRNSFGFLKHYFFIINQSVNNNELMEIHPGADLYKIIRRTNYSVCQLLVYCDDCFSEKMKQITNFYKIWYFPFVNCEILVCQTLSQLILLLIIISCVICKLLIFLPFLLIILQYSNYLTLKKIQYCPHLSYLCNQN